MMPEQDVARMQRRAAPHLDREEERLALEVGGVHGRRALPGEARLHRHDGIAAASTGSPRVRRERGRQARGRSPARVSDVPSHEPAVLYDKRVMTVVRR